eukprot:4186584-Amphidinium_carterae.1
MLAWLGVSFQEIAPNKALRLPVHNPDTSKASSAHLPNYHGDQRHAASCGNVAEKRSESDPAN